MCGLNGKPPLEGTVPGGPARPNALSELAAGRRPGNNYAVDYTRGYVSPMAQPKKKSTSTAPAATAPADTATNFTPVTGTTVLGEDGIGVVLGDDDQRSKRIR